MIGLERDSVPFYFLIRYPVRRRSPVGRCEKHARARGAASNMYTSSLNHVSRIVNTFGHELPNLPKSHVP